MWVLVVRRACLSLSNNNSPTVTRPCMKMPITNVLPPPPIPPFSSVRRSRFFAGDVEWKMKRLSNFSNSLNAGWNFFFRGRICSRSEKEEKVWMQGERETTRDKVFYMFVFFPSSFFFRKRKVEGYFSRYFPDWVEARTRGTRIDKL